ncbi:MAG: GntR family transcriptional regulator [Shimia sp.]
MPEGITRALPKHIRIAERLTRDIAAGRLADGARLAPERDMAAELGIAVGTLRRALALLTERGMLERRQGSGNYVQRQRNDRSIYALFRLELIGGGGLPSAQLMSREVQGGVATFRRLRLLDDVPIAVEEIVYRGPNAEAFVDGDLSEALYESYRDRAGVTIARIEDRVSAAAFPDWSPLSPGATAGYVERRGWTDDTTEVEASSTWFDTSRATYVSRGGT